MHHNESTSPKQLVDEAMQAVESMDWLSPISSLDSERSGVFGRHIESSLNAMQQNKEQSVKRLQLRRHDAAVVMSIERYEELVRMKQLYEGLVERIKTADIAKAANEYDALYSQITSSQSRQASDALFAASDSDLRQTYQPGLTENR
jgi:hypothetical protein